MQTPTPGRQPGLRRRTAAWRSRTLAGAAAAAAGHDIRSQLRLGRKGLAIGVDIGGTKVAAGVVDAEGRILSQAKRSTPGSDPRAVEQVIVELVEELGAGHRIWSLGSAPPAGWTSTARQSSSVRTWHGATNPCGTICSGCCAAPSC